MINSGQVLISLPTNQPVQTVNLAANQQTTVEPQLIFDNNRLPTSNTVLTNLTNMRSSTPLPTSNTALTNLTNMRSSASLAADTLADKRISNEAILSTSQDKENNIQSDLINEDYFNNSEIMDQFSFCHSQSDEIERVDDNQHNPVQTLSATSSAATASNTVATPTTTRTRRRIQHSKHELIRQIYRSGNDANGNDENGVQDRTSEIRNNTIAQADGDGDLLSYLKEREIENKRKLTIEIPKYRLRLKEVSDLRKLLKEKTIRFEDLTADQTLLIKRRRKNQRFYDELDNRIYMIVRSSIIKRFFDKTIEEILKVDKSPISISSLDSLCRKVFLYLYYQGITTYKDASAQVGSVFTALVCIYDDIYEDDYGGGFRLKSYFLKQMQNIRSTMSTTGLIRDDDFTDEPPRLDENLPA